jgi:hypothetical protein
LPLPASEGPAFPSPSMGTPLLQQISLMNNAVLEKIEETQGIFFLTKVNYYAFITAKVQH